MAELLVPFVADRAEGLAGRLIEAVGSLGAAMAVDPDQVGDPELSEACRIVQAARRLSQGALIEDFARVPVAADDPRLIDYLRTLLGDVSEAFCAIYLDREGRYIGDELLAHGSASCLCVTPRILFSRGFEMRASRLIVAHNHPSGNCRPSPQDQAATQTLAQMGSMLDLQLIDHLIITRRSYFSFSKGGLL